MPHHVPTSGRDGSARVSESRAIHLHHEITWSDTAHSICRCLKLVLDDGNRSVRGQFMTFSFCLRLCASGRYLSGSTVMNIVASMLNENGVRSSYAALARSSSEQLTRRAASHSRRELLRHMLSQRCTGESSAAELSGELQIQLQTAP